MARHKNTDWNLAAGRKQPDGSETHDWNSIHAALLMDIRDELQELNRTLSCYRVARMADATIRAERRLAQRMPLRTRRRA